MNGHDPVDQLLQRAFEADAELPPARPVAGQIMATIRRRRRIRTVVLAASAGLGVAAATLLSAPAVDDLGRVLGALRLDTGLLDPASLPAILQTALPAAWPAVPALVLVLLGWFACLEEESGAL